MIPQRPQQPVAQARPPAAVQKPGVPAGQLQPAQQMNQQQQARQNQLNHQQRRAELAKLDQKMVDTIIQTILDKGPGVTWDDIQGLHGVKQTLVENIVYP